MKFNRALLLTFLLSLSVGLTGYFVWGVTAGLMGFGFTFVLRVAEDLKKNVL